MSNVIEVTNLTKRFGRLVAVDDVSFVVKEGEIFGLVAATFATAFDEVRVPVEGHAPGPQEDEWHSIFRTSLVD